MASPSPSISRILSRNPQYALKSHMDHFTCGEKNVILLSSKSLKSSFNVDDEEMPKVPEEVVRETLAIFPRSPATIFIETKGGIPPLYSELLAVILAAYIQPFLEDIVFIIPVIFENGKTSEAADLRERVLEEYSKEYPARYLLMTPDKSSHLLQAAQVAMALGAFLIRQQEKAGKQDMEMEESMMQRLSLGVDDDVFDKFVDLGRILYGLNLPSPRLTLFSWHEGQNKELQEWTNPTHIRCDGRDSDLKELLGESTMQLFSTCSEEIAIVYADITTKMDGTEELVETSAYTTAQDCVTVTGGPDNGKTAMEPADLPLLQDQSAPEADLPPIQDQSAPEADLPPLQDQPAPEESSTNTSSTMSKLETEGMGGKESCNRNEQKLTRLQGPTDDQTEEIHLLEEVLLYVARWSGISVGPEDAKDWLRRLRNVRIYGVEDEDPENCEEKVVNFLNHQLKLTSLGPDCFDKAYRCGHPSKRQQREKERAIVVHFKRMAVRNMVLEAKSELKGTSFRITEDVTPRNLQLFHNARRHWNPANVQTTYGLVSIKTGYGREMAVNAFAVPVQM